MNIRNKLAFLTLAGALLIGAHTNQALAQAGESSPSAVSPFAEAAPAEDSPSGQTPAAPTPKITVTAQSEPGWHFVVAPYLWFAGMHGDVGALGHQASPHASFADIFNYLNIGIMVAAEPQYKRFAAPVDFLWLKLSDDKALPFEVGPTSIKAKVNQTMLSPKVSYRLFDGQMVKVDGNFGIRYFHLGTTLEFTGTGRQPSFYQSANWVDYIGGGRIVANLSPKILVTVFGDAGAGGANLDYQIAGALGYKLKPKIALLAGWRYLDVNYRPHSTFVYNTATSGLIIGATFNLK
jgi:hypothetical protein